jgi:type II restriction/modification system DNA methylase subunit YeeA
MKDERKEAQLFSERLFQAFGHEGLIEAGASLEFRLSKNAGKGGVSFADLMWKPRMLMEMKSAGAKLHLHYKQAFDYWIAAVPERPRYVVLCNFREFWIYDFDKQLAEPVDIVTLEELPKRYTAFNFMLPVEQAPIFDNDKEQISREAADQLAELFKLLVRGAKDEATAVRARRFLLQLIVAMFAEDMELLPRATVVGLVNDCLENKQSPYDLFGGLFNQMNNSQPASGGRYKDVPYFNGGLFSVVEPIDLTTEQLTAIGGSKGVARKDWSSINPAIFGTLFQDSMDKEKRHALGAHFTAEADIQRIVGPTIVEPWQALIDAAKTMKDLLELRKQLADYRVLDPSCGSGNFLYVAYRELARLDLRILLKLREDFSEAEFTKQAKAICHVKPSQFYGLDVDPIGVELAKVTLMLAKKLAFDEAAEILGVKQGELDLDEGALPLDNLDTNIVCTDALFADWPEADAVIGNPPYQSKNKVQEELGADYMLRLREAYPDMNGMADYCVYWFRRTQDYLDDGKRAGLVGTNTVRETYSREAGLDYILNTGGTITEAVSSMAWRGEASVHVSIVNWVKGPAKGTKRLYIQVGNDPDKGWKFEDLAAIGPSLSFDVDVTKAKSLNVNKKAPCFQGQTHGHKGFLMTAPDAKLAIVKDPKLAEVVHPFLIGNDLIGKRSAKPTRYVIDFQGKTVLQAGDYALPFEFIEKNVLPDRKKKAEKEIARNIETQKIRPKARVNVHHQNFLNQWWKLSYGRARLITALQPVSRYIVCARVTKRPIFAFIDPKIRPNDALQVFVFEDDYSFGILQSAVHWAWFTNRCSTLTERYRYTSNTVWDSFPWPQQPTKKAVENVAAAAVELRNVRTELMKDHKLSLRQLYASIEKPGAHPLKDVHQKLDGAVRKAYGMSAHEDVLAFLLQLNATLAKIEAKGETIQGPGIPMCISDPSSITTADKLSP